MANAPMVPGVEVVYALSELALQERNRRVAVPMSSQVDAAIEELLRSDGYPPLRCWMVARVVAQARMEIQVSLRLVRDATFETRLIDGANPVDLMAAYGIANALWRYRLDAPATSGARISFAFFDDVGRRPDTIRVGFHQEAANGFRFADPLCGLYQRAGIVFVRPPNWRTEEEVLHVQGEGFYSKLGALPIRSNDALAYFTVDRPMLMPAEMIEASDLARNFVAGLPTAAWPTYEPDRPWATSRVMPEELLQVVRWEEGNSLPIRARRSRRPAPPVEAPVPEGMRRTEQIRVRLIRLEEE